MARQRPPRKGFTLPEILISTGILSLVLVACHALVSFAIKWNFKMTDSVETYRRALQASSKVAYDLGAGSQQTFLYDIYDVDDVDGFAVATARPQTGPFQLDASNSILMHRWVIYQRIDNTLFRNEILIDPPKTRGALMNEVPEPDYTTLRTSLTEPGVIVADDVVQFEVYGISGAIVNLKVEGDKESETGQKVNSIGLRSRVNFRI